MRVVQPGDVADREPEVPRDAARDLGDLQVRRSDGDRDEDRRDEARRRPARERQRASPRRVCVSLVEGRQLVVPATSRPRRCGRLPRTRRTGWSGSGAFWTALSWAVAGLLSRSSIFCAAVFQLASTRTMTLGSAATMLSQPADVQVSCTSAKMLVSPAASIIICGAPMPAPTYGVSVPELYQSAVVSLGGLRHARERGLARSAISASARSGTPKMLATSRISSSTSSNVSGSGM